MKIIAKSLKFMDFLVWTKIINYKHKIEYKFLLPIPFFLSLYFLPTFIGDIISCGFINFHRILFSRDFPLDLAKVFQKCQILLILHDIRIYLGKQFFCDCRCLKFEFMGDFWIRFGVGNLSLIFESVDFTSFY